MSFPSGEIWQYVDSFRRDGPRLSPIDALNKTLGRVSSQVSRRKEPVCRRAASESVPVLLNVAPVDSFHGSCTSWQQDELCVGDSCSRPLAIGRKFAGHSFAQRDRRRACHIAHRHRIVWPALLSLLVKEQRFAVRRNVLGKRPVEPRKFLLFCSSARLHL